MRTAHLLIVGDSILAEAAPECPFVETDDRIIWYRQDDPTVEDGCVMRDRNPYTDLIEVPDDFTVQDYYYPDDVITKKPVITPPPEVPEEVTMRQARLALLAAGRLGDVDTAIASLPSPQKEEAQIEWDYSNAVQRNRPFVLQLGQALGLSSSDLDKLFITASTL